MENIPCTEEKSEECRGAEFPSKSDRQQTRENGVVCHLQKMPEPSVVPRSKWQGSALTFPRGTPIGRGWLVPRGLFGQEATLCKSWLYLSAACVWGTLLTISKLLFPHLYNHDNASTHLIG